MLKHLANFVSATALMLSLCSANQSAFAQGSCLISMEEYLSTLPAFSAPDLQNVAKSLRFEGAKHLQAAREGTLSPQLIAGYEQQMQEFRNSGRTAMANHVRLGGKPDETACNPPQASQAMAWAATQMGVAFNTWAINTIRCAAGDNNLAPIPQFCPYIAQTAIPGSNALSRDDPKVLGRSARGG
jgi:hypothetical protein